MSNLYPPASSPNDPLGSREPYDAQGDPSLNDGFRESSSTPVFDTVAPGTPPPTYVPPQDETSQSRTDVAKEQAAQTKDTAKEEAAHVKDTAVGEAKNVAATAKTEAANVAGEAKTQFKDLYRESTKQLSSQAAQQQERAASGLQALSGEFRDLADKGDGGIAVDLVRQVADRAGAVGDWLGARGPGEVLNEVKSFARRKPGTFIAIAAITGLVAGRLTRSLAEAAKDDHDQTSSTPAAPSATGAASTAPEASYLTDETAAFANEPVPPQPSASLLPDADEHPFPRGTGL